jgi:hypothetical protein
VLWIWIRIRSGSRRAELTNKNRTENKFSEVFFFSIFGHQNPRSVYTWNAGSGSGFNESRSTTLQEGWMRRTAITPNSCASNLGSNRTSPKSMKGPRYKQNQTKKNIMPLISISVLAVAALERKAT